MSNASNQNKSKSKKPLSIQSITTRSSKKNMETRPGKPGNSFVL